MLGRIYYQALSLHRPHSTIQSNSRQFGNRMNKAIEDRLHALECRLERVESQLELYQALSTYGPAVDSLSLDLAASLWTHDGVYDIGDERFDMAGHADILDTLNADYHKDLVAKGCAHTMSLPLIAIKEQQAIGLGYHRLYTHEDTGFGLHRLSVSRWDWVKESGRWVATRRTHRLLDGSPEARELIRQTLADMQSLKG